MRIFRFLVGCLSVIGFLTLILVGAGGVIGGYFLNKSHPKLAQNVVIQLVLDGDGMVLPAGNGLNRLLGKAPDFDGVIATIDEASTDSRVKGLIVRLGTEGPSLAKVQALRAAVERFRKSGRFALAYANSYGNGSYTLASAFDEVWLQPLGMVALTGVAADVPFAKRAFDALGVLPQFEKREAYKSTPDSFTESGFTPEHREMMQSVVDDLSRQTTHDIAISRRLVDGEVTALINKAPLLDREAVAGHLVDHLGYRDQFIAAAKTRGANANIVSLDEYRDAAGLPQPGSRDPAIAIVTASGTIADGEDPGADSGQITPGVLVPAIDAAAKDDRVKAIVLRIDSGGGSVSASESIRRAVANARDHGKPVVVSMGDMAASGGYWIAMNADRIIAEPATLTGSIGVFAGKVSVGGLSQRLGIDWGSVTAGRNAGMWSVIAPFDDAAEARIAAFTDDIYGNFVAKVAEARHMTTDAAHAVAQGRVWTGAQAVEKGLVDELGDRNAAIRAARDLAQIPAYQRVRLEPFPKPKSALEELLNLVDQKGGLLRGVATFVLPLMPAEWRAAADAVFSATDAGVEARMAPISLR